MIRSYQSHKNTDMTWNHVESEEALRTQRCIDKAEHMGNVELVSYDDILRYHETR